MSKRRFNDIDNSDTGQDQYPEYSDGLHTAPARMIPINGCEVRNPYRNTPPDVDLSPYLVRRFTNMSMTDVQLNNGLHHGIGSGRRIAYDGSGYLYAVTPIIPGQTRDNAAGFHRRGPSPYNYQNMWDAGPGSQPVNPGGPGKIAAPTFINPMTG